MTPVATPRPPGNLTVPPLDGWQEILTVLAVVIGAAVAFLLIAAVATLWTRRSEWQAYLAARSRHDRGRVCPRARAAPPRAGSVRRGHPGPPAAGGA